MGPKKKSASALKPQLRRQPRRPSVRRMCLAPRAGNPQPLPRPYLECLENGTPYGACVASGRLVEDGGRGSSVAASRALTCRTCRYPCLERAATELAHCPLCLEDGGVLIARTDHLRIIALVEAALAFAIDVLEEDGTCVGKVLAGGAELTMQNQLKKAFRKVANVKPPASRADSSEKFVVAQGFRGLKMTQDDDPRDY